MKRQDLTKRIPLISICITSFNYDRFIRSAVVSALTQSYPNIEVVISDNCSTDDTFNVLAEFRTDPRVRIYVNEKPLSMVANHNTVVKYAKGDYVVLLSADDVLLPHHVETLMARMENRLDPVDIVRGQATYCDVNLAPLGTPAAHGVLPVAYSHRDEFATMLFIYSCALPANLIPKSVYEYVGYFDEAIAHSFEVDFALRIELAGFRIAVIPDVLVAVRAHPEAACSIRGRDMLMYHREKLYYLEKFTTPEHAWRLDYVGRHIANVLEFERAMIPPEQIDEETLEQSQRLAELLRTFASRHHRWPDSRPGVSVIVHTHGATKQLLATLDALWAQDVGNIEILVVQTQGIGIEHLLQTRAYANSVRFVKASHLRNSGGVLRLGIELARAPYVAYLEEGQSIPQDQLASLVAGLERDSVDFVVADASSVHATHAIASTEHNGDTPFIPVQRGEVIPQPGALTFSQILLRRNLLVGTVLFDSLYAVSEQEFIEAMQFHFQYVFFERRVITEFIGGSNRKN